MKIIIKDKNKLSEIQEIFKNYFPSLKIEFFTFKPGSKIKFSKENMISNTNQTFGQIGHFKKEFNISINGNQKVATLESNFLDNFGIYIQVFRKSGKNWIETSTSDNLTLAQQNRKGIESMFKTPKETAPDYDQYHEQS